MTLKTTVLLHKQENAGADQTVSIKKLISHSATMTGVKSSSIKGTVAFDLDWLKVMLLDRYILGGEPLVFF